MRNEIHKKVFTDHTPIGTASRLHKAEWPYISREVGADVYLPLHNCLRSIDQEINAPAYWALEDLWAEDPIP